MNFLLNLIILVDHLSWFIFLVSGVLLILSRIRRVILLAISVLLMSFFSILNFLFGELSETLIFQLIIAWILFTSIVLQSIFYIAFFYSNHKYFIKFLIISIVYIIISLIILLIICILTFPLPILQNPAFSILLGTFYLPITFLIIIRIFYNFKFLLQKDSQVRDLNQKILLRITIGLFLIIVSIIFIYIDIPLISDIFRICSIILITQGYVELALKRFSFVSTQKIIDLEKDLQQNIEIKKLLEESLIKLQNANDAKVAFLSNLSHELRTPLNPIIAYSEILLTYDYTNLTEDQKSFITSIQKSATKLLHLIDQLLNASLIQQGITYLDYKEFSLPDLIMEVVQYFEEHLRHKNLSLHLDVGDNVNHITSDRMKLEQILFAILDNAIKFSFTNTEIGVDVKITDKTLIMSITDEGLLIHPDDFPKLFKPFSQLEDPISKKYQGIGLGLYFCHQIVLLLQGSIRVNSVEKCTKFTVFIPMELNKNLKIPSV